MFHVVQALVYTSFVSRQSYWVEGGEGGDSEKPKEVYLEEPSPGLGQSVKTILSVFLPLGFLSYLMPL